MNTAPSSVYLGTRPKGEHIYLAGKVGTSINRFLTLWSSTSMVKISGAALAEARLLLRMN